MSDLEQIVTDIVAEAEARHRGKATEYYDALRRIISICDEHGSGDFNVIRMIAARASSPL